MAVLEKVIQMKQQGATEPQIIDILRQEGVSPREINEALSQSSIKSAINTEQEEIPQPEEPYNNFQTPEMQSQITPMQPSMVPMEYQQNQEGYQQQGYAQQDYQNNYTQSNQIQRQQPREYEQSQQQYPPQEYYEEYAPQQTSDIEIINDIAEQIVEEKNSELKKQISSFTDFKESISLEVERLNERLTKIENISNELQIAILKKIGSYGESLENIEKEMHMTQNSFSKIINPLTDRARQMSNQESNQEKPTPSRPKPKIESKREKTSFEDYLR
ncbi:MAG: hypothetical protein WCX73_05120 [Candidatus Pacearchaeota archaeon]